jgi:hypothetical protein
MKCGHDDQRNLGHYPHKSSAHTADVDGCGGHRCLEVESMNLTSDSSQYAELWPFLWIGMIIVFGLWVYHKIKKGKWK